MNEFGIPAAATESVEPPTPTYNSNYIANPVYSKPDTWKLYAQRLGKDTYPGGGKLMFEGSFKDAHDFLDFLERIPMNTPGMEAIKTIQNPQPYIVRAVGPLVTVKLSNLKTCLGMDFTA